MQQPARLFPQAHEAAGACLVNEIHQNTTRFTMLHTQESNRILIIDRLQKKLQAAQEAVYMHEIADEVCALIRPLCAEGVALRNHVPSKLPPVQVGLHAVIVSLSSEVFHTTTNTTNLAQAATRLLCW